MARVPRLIQYDIWRREKFCANAEQVNKDRQTIDPQSIVGANLEKYLNKIMFPCTFHEKSYLGLRNNYWTVIFFQWFHKPFQACCGPHHHQRRRCFGMTFYCWRGRKGDINERVLSMTITSQCLVLACVFVFRTILDGFLCYLLRVACRSHEFGSFFLLDYDICVFRIFLFFLMFLMFLIFLICRQRGSHSLRGR